MPSALPTPGVPTSSGGLPPLPVPEGASQEPPAKSSGRLIGIVDGKYMWRNDDGYYFEDRPKEKEAMKQLGESSASTLPALRKPPVGSTLPASAKKGSK